MEKIKISELNPIDGRKSFYGKAKIYHNPISGALYLISYDTPIARFCDGHYRRYWDERSATTTRHLKAFFDYCGVPLSIGEFYKIGWERAPMFGLIK